MCGAGGGRGGKSVDVGPGGVGVNNTQKYESMVYGLDAPLKNRIQNIGNLTYFLTNSSHFLYFFQTVLSAALSLKNCQS